MKYPTWLVLKKRNILRGIIINDMEIILVTISRVPLRQPEPRNYEIIFILAESRGQRSNSVFTWRARWRARTTCGVPPPMANQPQPWPCGLTVTHAVEQPDELKQPTSSPNSRKTVRRASNIHTTSWNHIPTNDFFNIDFSLVTCLLSLLSSTYHIFLILILV